MIEKLQSTRDPLVRKFSERKIRPLKTDNQYHSLENSEVDQSNPTGYRIICHKFLHEYVDKLFEETSK
ncbi:18689_t:CDS:2, partial [Funneliformis geosporum]